MDWQQIFDWFWLGLAQLWSFFLVSFFVYSMGALSKVVAKKKGWKGTEENPSWFDIWQRFAPFPGGAVWGLVPLPTLHAIENIADGSYSLPEVAARMGWFALAGALCGQTYEFGTFVYGVVKKRLGAMAAPTEGG